MITDTQADLLATRLRLQRYEDEIILLREALRQIAKAGRLSIIRDGKRVYYTSRARLAFDAAERITSVLDGREPHLPVGQLAERIDEIMRSGSVGLLDASAVNYPAVPA